MQVTELLQRARDGDSEALNEVMPLVYEELRRLANRHLQKEWNGAVSSTTLVHEAYMRLVKAHHPNYENRSHFFGMASRMMRQILIDAARARNAAKRADGLQRIELTELEFLGEKAGSSPMPDRPLLLDVSDAIDRLAAIHERKAKMVEMRFFAGMTADEIAEALGLPTQTVRQELRIAQAWLRKELSSHTGTS
jgi:RNA polymerase sigma factor (TIGR02999 family)